MNNMHLRYIKQLFTVHQVVFLVSTNVQCVLYRQLASDNGWCSCAIKTKFVDVLSTDSP